MTERTATAATYVILLVQGMLLALPMFHTGTTPFVVFIVGTHFCILALASVFAATRRKVQ